MPRQGKLLGSGLSGLGRCTMGTQKDLFDGIGAGVADPSEARVSAVASLPAKPAGGGDGGGTLPPHFAPMAAEYGDALPLGRYAARRDHHGPDGRGEARRG